MGLLEFIKSILCNKPTVDIPSPRDIIDQKYITYDGLSQEVVIGMILPDVWLTTVQDTNSMDGTIDFGHTMILSNNDEYLDGLSVGDIIVWQKYVQWGSVYKQVTILHQVIEIGDDGEWYCETKGLNVSKRDPYKIRREDITYIALGIIW